VGLDLRLLSGSSRFLGDFAPLEESELLESREAIWGQLREAWIRVPPDHGSTGDAVYRVLRTAIVANKLPAGIRLSEQVIADALNVSRTPVREALVRLASDKLVERDPRGRLRIHALSRKRVLDIYVVRRSLEGLAARLAAQYCDEAAAFELSELNDELRRAAAADESADLGELNIRFHEAVARAGRNDELVDMMRQIHRWVRRLPTTTLSYPGRLAAAHTEHGAILEAIKARDADKADALAQKHLSASLAIRLAMLFPDDNE
jgi:DNA-binding GntR family transcriptional regulator